MKPKPGTTILCLRLTVDGIRTEELKVNDHPNIIPAARCDFVAGGNSCNSKFMYENRPDLSHVDWEFYCARPFGFIYCLPENVEEARRLLAAKLLEALRRRLNEYVGAVQLTKGRIETWRS